MRTDDLDYPLPPDRIAQIPAEPRDAARLLVDRGPRIEPRHSTVADLAAELAPGDLVVVNDTRVLPARVAVRRDSGGAGEVLLVDDRGASVWEALCRPSRKLVQGTTVRSAGGHMAFAMGEDLGAGRRLVTVLDPAGEPLEGADLLGALERDGTMPLPPYIHDPLADQDRYQTTYSRRPASAAAPTAGLHLTPAVFADLDARGVQVARVELVVGLDTFRPVTVERVADHPIHSEYYNVDDAAWEAVHAAGERGAAVVAVGTTTVRALESRAATGEPAGRTSLFILPGFDFAVVDRLMTNFHLPRSSLLALVEAFIGPRWRDLYTTAVDQQYRFLSFGDAMLLDRAGAQGRAAAGRMGS